MHPQAPAHGLERDPLLDEIPSDAPPDYTGPPLPPRPGSVPRGTPVPVPIPAPVSGTGYTDQRTDPRTYYQDSSTSSGGYKIPSAPQLPTRNRASEYHGYGSLAAPESGTEVKAEENGQRRSLPPLPYDPDKVRVRPPPQRTAPSANSSAGAASGTGAASGGVYENVKGMFSSRFGSGSGSGWNSSGSVPSTYQDTTASTSGNVTNPASLSSSSSTNTSKPATTILDRLPWTTTSTSSSPELSAKEQKKQDKVQAKQQARQDLVIKGAGFVARTGLKTAGKMVEYTEKGLKHANRDRN